MNDLGWIQPANWRKAHYFREDRRSLCGKYGALGHPKWAFETENGPSPHDCAACRRKLDKDGVR